MSVPSPATASMNAAELLAAIRERGGRVYRYKAPPQVICLTNDPTLVQWLVARKAALHTPKGLTGVGHDGSYRRAKDLREWDLRLDAVPVIGEQTIWEEAGRG